MNLYRYRSIYLALKEIDNECFHFSSKEELNDPLEGYLNVFWKGDIPAWEGLFRNYICSFFYALEFYLLGQDENVLWNNTVLMGVHDYDDIPMGEIFQELGDKFLEEDDVIRIINTYGKNEYKCSYEELHFILRLLHPKVYSICLEFCKREQLIPAEDVDKVMFAKELQSVSTFPFERLEELDGDEERKNMFYIFAKILDDIHEFSIINFCFKEEGFGYGLDIDKAKKKESELANLKRGRQHRNWLSLRLDFPKMYVKQLEAMIYPKAYFICFSGKNNDSVMWGNYADNHKGVCLLYDAEEGSDTGAKSQGYYKYGSFKIHGFKKDDEIKTELRYKEEREYHKLNPKKVKYGGERIERNFFESLGRLTVTQAYSWLINKSGQASKYLNIYKDNSKNEKWRKEYWDVFLEKNYRKLDAWKYEDEYRMHIDNTFYEIDEACEEVNLKDGKMSRNLKYDMRLLKGVIFGINTSEYDKALIYKAISDKGVNKDFEFYQAYYNEDKREIEIHKKMWKR